MKAVKDQKRFRNVKAGDVVEIKGLSFNVRSAESQGRTIELELQQEDGGGVITINGVPDARIQLAAKSRQLVPAPPADKAE